MEKGLNALFLNLRIAKDSLGSVSSNEVDCKQTVDTRGDNSEIWQYCTDIRQEVRFVKLAALYSNFSKLCCETNRAVELLC